MHRSRQISRLAAVLAAVAIVVAACSSSGGDGNTGSPTLDRIKKAGVLRAGYAASLPWLGQDPKTNEYFGPNDLIGKKMAEKLGVKLERITQTFDQLVPAVQAGTIDLAVAPMYMTSVRLAVIDMAAWSKGGFCYLVRKDDTRINKAADLDNPEIRIANFEGTGGFQETSKKYPKAKQVTRAAAPGELAMFLEVQQNKADAATFDNPLAVVYEKQFPDLKIIPSSAECLKDPDIPTDIGVGFPKGDAALTKFVKDIITELQTALDAELLKYSDPQYLQAGS
ncbi:MAG: transporter substrate-binding domain-containing protein [Chloroflexi bacterium]|nr:transporter substrate-binding domain-containing protein [Chloroflexota bacterium]